jgi:hypothetical protein
MKKPDQRPDRACLLFSECEIRVWGRCVSVDPKG